MTAKITDRVELTLPQVLERYREMKAKGAGMVATLFHNAWQDARQAVDHQRVLVEDAHRADLAVDPAECLQPPEVLTIHYTELPAARPNSDLSQEWNYYRSQVGRLLEEGHERRFALIKGEQMIDIFDTLEEAEAVAYHKFPLEEHLIHQIQRFEKILRTSARMWRCSE